MKRGAIALSQIFLLILGIVAISYAIGSEIKVVSSAPPGFTLDQVENPEYGDVYKNNEGVYWFENDPDNFYVKDQQGILEEYEGVLEVERWGSDDPAKEESNIRETSTLTPEEKLKLNEIKSSRVNPPGSPIPIEAASSSLASLTESGRTPDVIINKIDGGTMEGALTVKEGKYFVGGTEVQASEIKEINVDGFWAGYGNGLVGNLAQGVMWSVYVVGAIQLFGNLFGI